jgi:hypothetical protein
VATRRTVETGLTSQGQVEIVAGLQVGETVVTTGANALRDGVEVRVIAGAGAIAADSATVEAVR